MNFVESKTKNHNLFNVALGSELVDHLSRVQYYFSQPSTVTLFKAPQTQLFDTQSNLVYAKTYEDLAKNYTDSISQFTRDYFSVLQVFISGNNDYLSYKDGTLDWLSNELNFVERADFNK